MYFSHLIQWLREITKTGITYIYIKQITKLVIRENNIKSQEKTSIWSQFFRLYYTILLIFSVVNFIICKKIKLINSESDFSYCL